MPQQNEHEKTQLNGSMPPPTAPTLECCPPPPPGLPPPGTVTNTTSHTALKIRPTMPDTLPEPRNEVRDSYLQLRRRLAKNGCDPDKMTFLAHYQQIAPILQDGPMCGLVALCMAAKLLGKDVKPAEALAVAQDENFSKQGEMFSVSHMADLAVKLTNCKYELWHGRQVCSDDVLIALSNNRPILLPYDADGNNEPCQKKGHKSHWAVLSGFLWGIETSEFSKSELLEQDSVIPELYHIKNEDPGLRQSEKPTNLPRVPLFLKLFNTEFAYVFAKQGKSAHTKLWPLKELLESNDNLIEVGNKIKSDIMNYLIPKEGIKRTLCGKALVLEKRSNIGI